MSLETEKIQNRKGKKKRRGALPDPPADLLPAPEGRKKKENDGVYGFPEWERKTNLRLQEKKGEGKVRLLRDREKEKRMM